MARESVYFRMEDLNSRHDVKEIKRELDALPGILSVSASPYDPKLAVDFDNSGVSREDIQKKLEELGYSMIPATDRSLRI
jgi:copper chaperone CopZ